MSVSKTIPPGVKGLEYLAVEGHPGAKVYKGRAAYGSLAGTGFILVATDIVTLETLWHRIGMAASLDQAHAPEVLVTQPSLLKTMPLPEPKK